MCAFFRIRTVYGELLRISLYSVQMWENLDQNNSKYGHFSRSAEQINESCSLVIDTIDKHRSSHQRCFIIKGVLRNFVKLRDSEIKRLWCFPVNFTKFLRNLFYRTPLGDCFRKQISSCNNCHLLPLPN